MKDISVICIVMLMFITMLLLIIDRRTMKFNNIQYTQFRDNNYTDFSNDKNYQHWLIDHQINNKE